MVKTITCALVVLILLASPALSADPIDVEVETKDGEKLRASQREEADKLFYQARNESDRGAKQEMWKRLVDEYYTSKWYPLVKRWLE